MIGNVLGWWVFDYFQGGDDRVEQPKVLSESFAQHDSSSLYSASPQKEKIQGRYIQRENLHQKRPKDQLVLA